jgi:hypothetical protein
MRRRRDLLVTNAIALVLLLAVLAIGWRMEALFGLGVLLFMDALVLIRERERPRRDEEHDGDQDQDDGSPENSDQEQEA